MNVAQTFVLLLGCALSLVAAVAGLVIVHRLKNQPAPEKKKSRDPQIIDLEVIPLRDKWTLNVGGVGDILWANPDGTFEWITDAEHKARSAALWHAVKVTGRG